jgi:hypothetical protein
VTRVVPTTPFETSGSVVQSSLWNSGPKAMGDYYLSPPMFRGHQSAAQAVASNTYVAMSLDVTDVDTDNGHSNVTNNTRYTCQVPGWYLAEGYVALVNNTGAQSILFVMLALNSTGGTPNTVPGLQQRLIKGANSFTAASGSGMLKMAAGDYLEVWTWQDSGSSINTAPNTDLCPALNLLWVHS